MKESDKGDIGVSLVTADLIKKGFEILFPVSASLPYDLVMHKKGKFYKVQVKYRENRKGFLEVECRRANSKGKYRKNTELSRGEVDLFAVYCPDTGKVYYLGPKIFECHQNVRIRLEKPSKFRENCSVNWADNYLTLDFLDLPQ